MGKTFTNMVYELGKLSINGELKPIPNDRYFGFQENIDAGLFYNRYITQG